MHSNQLVLTLEAIKSYFKFIISKDLKQSERHTERKRDSDLCTNPPMVFDRVVVDGLCMQGSE